MYDIQITDGGQYGYDIAKITTDRDSVPLVCIQDVHIGAGTWYRKRFEELVKYIHDTDALWFYNGDGIDNGTKHSPGNAVAEQDMTNNAQLRYLTEQLKPYAHNCIGLNGGNHDHRTKKDSQFDLTEELAYNLGAHYFLYEMYFIIAKRDHNGGTGYVGYANHSASAGKTSGLTANAVERDWVAWNENVDIFVKGHDHNVGLFPIASNFVDTSNVHVRERIRWIWLPGSFLGRAKSYAGKKPYSPQPKLYYSTMLDMRKGKKNVLEVRHAL